MRNIIIFLIVTFIIITSITLAIIIRKRANETFDKQNIIIPTTIPNSQIDMKISLKGIEPGSPIPERFTCEGLDLSPEIIIENVPNETTDLVLIVDDTDAPSGDFVHWIVWNIDPKTADIAEGKIPLGSISGKNDFGKIGYSGPCPPSNTHHYFFRLYALDTKINLPQGSNKADFQNEITDHIMDKAEFMVTYTKK